MRPRIDPLRLVVPVSTTTRAQLGRAEMRGAVLLCASSLSAAVGFLGCALLAYSIGTHLLTPGPASTSRDLFFDLTQPAPVATASFLQQDLNSLRALSKV